MTAPDPRLAVADGLMDLIVGPEWRKMPSFAGRRDAILAALKAEGERAAERMRERAAKVADAKNADLRDDVGEWRYGPEEIATAIRALPTDKET